MRVVARLRLAAPSQSPPRAPSGAETAWPAGTRGPWAVCGLGPQAWPAEVCWRAREVLIKGANGIRPVRRAPAQRPETCEFRRLWCAGHSFPGPNAPCMPDATMASSVANGRAARDLPHAGGAPARACPRAGPCRNHAGWGRGGRHLHVAWCDGHRCANGNAPARQRKPSVSLVRRCWGMGGKAARPRGRPNCSLRRVIAPAKFACCASLGRAVRPRRLAGARAARTARDAKRLSHGVSTGHSLPVLLRRVWAPPML